MSSATSPITLSVAADARYARLVRMTAANAAMLSSMSVDKIEDVRMAAEEAFIYACSTASDAVLEITFDVDDERIEIVFGLGSGARVQSEPEGPAAYADLILFAVCDSYEKTEEPCELRLVLRADV